MMYKYDVFFSCSRKYDEYHYNLCDFLRNKDIRCFDWRTELQAGFEYKKQISDALCQTEFFVILLSPELIGSKYMKEELLFAQTNAEKYGVKIIPILDDSIAEKSLNKNWLNDIILQYCLSDTQIIKGTFEEILDKLVSIVNKSKKLRLLYDEADQAWNFGAYERAYNVYLKIAKIQTGSARISAYERSLHCCKKGGQIKEAERLEKIINELKVSDGSTSNKPIFHNSTNWEKPCNIKHDLYEKIANYGAATIDLFEELLKNGDSIEGINCLKTGCFRLMNYCKTVGGMENIISDILTKMQTIEKNEIDRKHQVENKDEIVKSYRTYLGLDMPGADNYDVFISYKSEDEAIARRVYEFLVENGKKVFFSCEVLPELGKTEYREAIMDALDHSQHFVLVTSRIDYILSNWVREEWSCFVSKLIEDNHSGNIVMVVQDDCKIDKNTLPLNIRFKQRILMSGFRKTLMKYLQ